MFSYYLITMFMLMAGHLLHSRRVYTFLMQSLFLTGTAIWEVQRRLLALEATAYLGETYGPGRFSL
jgi:hypothetical protein